MKPTARPWAQADWRHGVVDWIKENVSPRGYVEAGENVAVLLADLGTPEFRHAWWVELEMTQPAVACRLMAKFPERYPVPEPKWENN